MENLSDSAGTREVRSSEQERDSLTEAIAVRKMGEEPGLEKGERMSYFLHAQSILGRLTVNEEVALEAAMVFVRMYECVQIPGMTSIFLKQAEQFLCRANRCDPRVLTVMGHVSRQRLESFLSDKIKFCEEYPDLGEYFDKGELAAFDKLACYQKGMDFYGEAERLWSERDCKDQWAVVLKNKAKLTYLMALNLEEGCTEYSKTELLNLALGHVDKALSLASEESLVELRLLRGEIGARVLAP